VNETIAQPGTKGDRLWDVKDVSGYLGVSKSWIYQRVSANELPHRRIGGLIRFFPDEIHAFAQEARAAVAPILPLRR
jgi:excisionase family DNA binding protein